MQECDDLTLCQHVLAGDEAAAVAFRAHYYPLVYGVVFGRCGDSRSKAEAEDIAEGVIADCYGANGKPPLLTLYSGRAPLESWLCRVAINRLKNLWRSGRWRYEQSADLDDEGVSEFPNNAQGSGDGEAELIARDSDVAELFGEAIVAAFRDLPPRDVIFLRLVYLHKVPRVRIAETWGCDPATVGRSMQRSLGALRAKTMDHLRHFDENLEISWEDCHAMCSRWPLLLARAGNSERRRRGDQEKTE